MTSHSSDTPSEAPSSGSSNMSSSQPKQESDNSVFDGGGGIQPQPNPPPTSIATSNATNNGLQRNSPTLQYSTSLSPNNHQQMSPRPRAPSVPHHLLTHHQFWSPNTVQGFATKRLLNGVISNAVNYVTGNNGAASLNMSTANNGSSGSNLSSPGSNSGEYAWARLIEIVRDNPR